MLDPDRETYRVLVAEREALMEEARVWLEKEGWVRGMSIPKELGMRLDASRPPEEAQRLFDLDNKIYKLRKRFREGRREGNNLRARFYALKDKLFAEAQGRPEVREGLVKGNMPLVDALSHAMDAMDIDPDDQGSYDRAVQLVGEMHVWLVERGFVKPSAPSGGMEPFRCRRHEGRVSRDCPDCYNAVYGPVR